MSGHADTIRRYIEEASDWGDAGVGCAEEMNDYRREGLAALDALVAENQQLRDALEGWLLFVMEYVADPEASAHIAANAELAILTTSRKPSAAQTLEDMTPNKEKAGS